MLRGEPYGKTLTAFDGREGGSWPPQPRPPAEDTAEAAVAAADAAAAAVADAGPGPDTDANAEAELRRTASPDGASDDDGAAQGVGTDETLACTAPPTLAAVALALSVVVNAVATVRPASTDSTDLQPSASSSTTAQLESDARFIPRCSCSRGAVARC